MPVTLSDSSLVELLNIRWGNHAVFERGSRCFQEIKQAVDKGELKGVVIQTEELKLNGASTLDFPRIWETKHWHQCYEKYQQDKLKSEINRQSYDIKKEHLVKLAEKFPLWKLNREIALDMARPLWESKNIETIKVLVPGIDLSDIIWPDEVEKTAVEMLPTLKENGIL